MNSAWVCFAAGMIVCLTGIGPCHGQAATVTAARQSLIRAAITAAYGKINAAGTSRDLERIMSYFTPDYAEVDVQGVTRNRQQMLSQYQDWLSRVHTMQGHYIIQALTVTPSGTLVDVRAHIDGTGEKRVLLARIQGTFANDLLVRDLWVKTPAGWRIKHRQTLTSETHMRPQ